MDRLDLENRLVKFAATIISLVGNLNYRFHAQHLGKQLIRSATSVALNYGEAQSAESRRDFIHKLKLVEKELRESMVCLKIIGETCDDIEPEMVIGSIKESNELISIIVRSVQTAKARM